QTSLGFTLTQLGQPADAIARFRHAIELGGDAASAHFGLIQAYLALGRTTVAREEYETLRTLDPELAGRIRVVFPPDRSP
ncbi:MAG: hypothetical protein DMD79_24475, partial [Candidatus Rokuibacteriota bacterium]